ncbi:MAG TPA: phosphoadenylyl-sulfate reductase [Bacillaceae bacterium]
MLTYEHWDDSAVAAILKAHPDYMDILKWAYREYGEEIVYACSFGAEGMVLIDLIEKVKSKAKIIFLDTGLHFKETYELIERVKERYPTLRIELLSPEITLEEQAKWYGESLWETNPNMCCHIRKVVPLQKALKETTAWISGLRRDQSPTRSKTEYINKDIKFQKIKVCPLIHWTWEDIMSYIRLNNLPYNTLHDRGYPSIGCAPCTQQVAGEGDSRAGRWAGHNKLECGLHAAEMQLGRNEQ